MLRKEVSNFILKRPPNFLIQDLAQKMTAGIARRLFF